MMLGFVFEGLVRVLFGKKFEVYMINFIMFICMWKLVLVWVEDFIKKLLFYFEIVSLWYEDCFFFVLGFEYFFEFVLIVKENCLFKEVFMFFLKFSE